MSHVCLHAHQLLSCADLCPHVLRPQAFEEAGTGLLVNERLINSPPKLGPPLLKFIMDEIKERAAEGGWAGAGGVCSCAMPSQHPAGQEPRA